MSYPLHGWKRDLPDHRDLVYRSPGLLRSLVRPARAYLRLDLMPPVYDQGNLGSCVGHGVAEGFDYVEAKEGNEGSRELSRLAVYYWARGGVPEDTGATIRDGIKGVAKHGAPLERLWPYDLKKWRDGPSLAAVEEGKHRAQGLVYRRCLDLSDIRDAIACGFPVVFGMAVYRGIFDVKADGFLPMPGTNEAPEGGHCLLAVGYADKLRVSGCKGALYVRNSWGPGYGDRGNLWVPYDYLDANADDFWSLSRMEP